MPKHTECPCNLATDTSNRIIVTYTASDYIRFSDLPGVALYPSAFFNWTTSPRTRRPLKTVAHGAITRASAARPCSSRLTRQRSTGLKSSSPGFMRRVSRSQNVAVAQLRIEFVGNALPSVLQRQGYRCTRTSSTRCVQVERFIIPRSVLGISILSSDGPGDKGRGRTVGAGQDVKWRVYIYASVRGHVLPRVSSMSEVHVPLVWGLYAHLR